MEQTESKGIIFKKKYGYSKTAKRLMQKYGINRNNTREALEQLREFRKKRRRRAAVIKRNKHIASREHMRLNGKVRTKGKKNKTETKENSKK